VLFVWRARHVNPGPLWTSLAGAATLMAASVGGGFLAERRLKLATRAGSRR
jgi:hypothetical protein